MMTSLPPSSSEPNPFDLLHPGVQRWVWLQGWPSLRRIQAQAIPKVLARDHDVVISAPTAGGKTEAAFLPILSDLAQQEGSGLRCICISPLRALINDQTRRLSSLAEAVDLRVQPWHGDVSAGRADFWKRPAEVLITTPESLEAMLMHRGGQLSKLAPMLRYLVIDELHAFFGSERGAQLRSLLQRVEHLSGQIIPRVALSATLGDPALAGRFLRPRQALPVSTLISNSGGGEIRLQMRAVQEGGAAAQPVPSENAPASSEDEESSDSYTTALGEVADHVFSRLRGESHLVFANSRRQVELLADQLRDRSELLGLPNEFFPHHGALSRELRLSVEERLRDGKVPTTAICTSTLEMGIDIGDVASVAQIGPPPSVSALKQRVGRSGRRANQAQVLRQYTILRALDSNSHPIDHLQLALLQSIASIELMLQGRFEPPKDGELHLSTFIQQILSLMVQHGGGISPLVLFEELCRKGAFTNIDQKLFTDVLRALGASKILEQASDGTLLPGSAAERLMEHYSFYATFHTPEEYQLIYKGKRLGTLPIVEPLVVDHLLLFAGRRWRILEVEQDRRIVNLLPARGGRPPRFGGGGLPVHAMVHQAMLGLLKGSDNPVYLDHAAQQALANARSAYHGFGFGESRLLMLDGNLELAHWGGTAVGHTLGLWLESAGIQATNDGPFLEIQGLDRNAALQALRRLASAEAPGAISLASQIKHLDINKLDGYLSRELQVRSFAVSELDVLGAKRALFQVLGEISDDVNL